MMINLYYFSGNEVKGELAVSSFNATTLREVGVAQTTTFRKRTYQECFVAKKILYCIGIELYNYDSYILLI